MEGEREGKREKREKLQTWGKRGEIVGMMEEDQE